MADINISSSFSRVAGFRNGNIPYAQTSQLPLGELSVFNFSATNFTGTGSLLGTSSFIDFSNVGNKPTLISSSLQFTNTDNVTFGGVTTSQIQVDVLHVSTVSASVEYSSGSNVFGSVQSNTHKFTGSVVITGSLRLNVTSTTGANSATLTNSPIVGNPAGWMTINVNGTNRYVPYW